MKRQGLTHSVTEVKHGKTVLLPTLASRPQGKLMEVRVQEGGESKCCPVTGQKGVELPGDITPRESGRTSTGSFFTGQHSGFCSWHLDETYIKVNGRWAYPYRAVDSRGRTVDFYFSPHRNTNAAYRFLGKILNNVKQWKIPRIISTDKAPTPPGHWRY